MKSHIPSTPDSQQQSTVLGTAHHNCDFALFSSTLDHEKLTSETTLTESYKEYHHCLADSRWSVKARWIHSDLLKSVNVVITTANSIGCPSCPQLGDSQEGWGRCAITVTSAIHENKVRRDAGLRPGCSGQVSLVHTPRKGASSSIQGEQVLQAEQTVHAKSWVPLFPVPESWDSYNMLPLT